MLRNIVMDAMYIFLVLGLIFYLIKQTVTILTTNIKVIGFVIFLFGMILFILFSVSLLVDYQGGKFLNNYYHYLLFIIESLAYTLFMSVPLFIKAKRRYIRIGISKKFNIQKGDKNASLYVLYKYDNDFYLVKDKDVYKGFVKQLKKTIFHDEAVDMLNKEMNVTGKSKYCGKVETNIKKVHTYYCYIVKLNEELNLTQFYKINAFELLNVNLSVQDKEIILNMLLKEDFNIKL